MKKLLIFDLDGTLTESKNSLTIDMAMCLESALKVFSIAVISGGSYPQFQKQFVSNLPLLPNQLTKLFLFPTCATSFYRYTDGWKCIYSQELNGNQKTKIMEAFQDLFEEIGFSTNGSYGQVLEDRGTQITFSALGQDAPTHLKRQWDPDFTKRLSMMDILRDRLSEFEIRAGGSTSIDVTEKGIDKAYGINQIEKLLGFKKDEMVFIGDALFAGGNDAAVKTTGVQCLDTSGPEETIRLINWLVSKYG